MLPGVRVPDGTPVPVPDKLEGVTVEAEPVNPVLVVLFDKGNGAEVVDSRLVEVVPP